MWLPLTSTPAGTPAHDAFGEPRLIDESAEPATGWSGEWSEPEPPVLEAERTGAPPVARAGAGTPQTPAARQPAGALSGKVVFTNGGHGWTFDPDRWRLQRPVLHGMVEDYGNLDQMNLFATHCFNAGAVVVPLRPLGNQPNEVVMDNDDPGVTFSGTWFDSTSPLYFGSPGDVPYRYARLGSAETATATYTPTIPERGFYPVYTWVRHGSDRGDQLYRIRHTGGDSTLTIPHHRVGNGWVYLGEYHFAAGADHETGSVTVSNLRSNPTGTYAFADAIRFGNGMGNVDRGGGVSTYPREDESCRYWVQASLGQGQSGTLYNGGGDDESDSWSTPPKMSAEMNRESAGDLYDRIHLSFHSNASGGSARGTVALTTSDPTPHQHELADLVSTGVARDLTALGSPPLEFPWGQRANPVFSGGYSEIDGSLFNYEMAATILEVAFHDNAEDARLLRDPTARSAVAKAALHGVIRYFNRHGSAPLAFPPNPPGELRATAAAGGTVTLEWDAPAPGAGSSPASGYVVYRSADGLGFGRPVTLAGSATSTTLTADPGKPEFFRVAATNSGGESLPTATAGCLAPATPGAARTLVVDAFDRFDRTTNPRQDVARQAYRPLGRDGDIDRVVPRTNNAFGYVAPHGLALAGAGAPFDSTPSSAVASGEVDLGRYHAVFWACGQESTADESFSASEQTAVRAFAAAGGHLFVSGSEVAWDLGRSGSGPSAADRAFLRDVLHADFASDADDDSGSESVAPAAGGIFEGLPPLTIEFQHGRTYASYPVRTPDVLTPSGSGAPALAYDGLPDRAAAVQAEGAGTSGGSVYLGFPLESVASTGDRNAIVARVLEFFFGEPGELLVAAGSRWQFEDTRTDLGTTWRDAGFDSSTWPSGPAPLGFGMAGLGTELDPDPARITTYFRHTFDVTDPDRFGELAIDLRRDDGAAVWINGHLAAITNLPANGPLAWETSATDSVTGDAESEFRPLRADARLLGQGANTIAVEVHQSGTLSNDLVFDFALTGSPSGPASYTDWQEVTFGSLAGDPALAGELADPDRDGTPNLVEYALATPGAAADPTPPYQLSVADGLLTISFARNASASDVSLTLEVSTSLAPPWLAVAGSSGTLPIDALVDGVTVDETRSGALTTTAVSIPLPTPGDPARNLNVRIRVRL